MAYAHDAVAHNWAHQTGRKQRGFNMYYEGRTIYSYGPHFPLATLFDAPNGERVVLLNDDSYSISTSKHQGIVRRAIGYDGNGIGRKAVFVPDLEAGGGYAHTYYHQALARIPGLIELWQRARSRKPDYVREIESNVALANRVRELWQLEAELPEATMPADLAAYLEAHKAKIEADRQAREEAARKAAIEQDKRDRRAIAKWLDGEDVRPPHTRVPYVRVVTSRQAGLYGTMMAGPWVQTSWGVTVPLKQALAVFRLAQRIRKAAADNTWRHPGFTPRKRHALGDFHLDHVAANGDIRAGCHLIPFKHAMAAAKRAGLA